MKQKGLPKKYKDELLEVVQKSAKDKDFLDQFLQDMLTPGEYEALAIRWQIVKLLAEGLTQREISQRLKIGLATITRGSRELHNKQGAFMKLLQPKPTSSWWSRSHT